MLRIAILDPVLPHQLAERPGDLEGVEVVWKGTSLDDMKSSVARLKPSVLVVDLDTVGALDAVARVRELQALSGAELVITLYRFARREVVEALTAEGRKAVKAPVSLAGLRTQMMGALVRSILTPSTTPSAATAEVPARTFTAAQLGRLAEIKSAVQCECPNHLSSLILSLLAFEDYSARCENMSPEDARVHRSLYEHTARAREVMERALEVLLVHEKIAL